MIIRSEVSQLRFRKYMVVYFVTVRGIVLPKRQAFAGIETETIFYSGICHLTAMFNECSGNVEDCWGFL